MVREVTPDREAENKNLLQKEEPGRGLSGSSERGYRVEKAEEKLIKPMEKLKEGTNCGKQ